jgi:hypothetical protein
MATSRYDALPVEELVKALEKLGVTLRRLALYLEFFELRVSALASDTRVGKIPRRLARFKRQEVSNN